MADTDPSIPTGGEPASPSKPAPAPETALGPKKQPRPSLPARLWSRVLDAGLVLWVVRIPLASVAAGLFLMLAVTQAQDTLVAVAMSGAPLAEQAGFRGDIAALIAATFLLWAMPVHYAARLLVETDGGLHDMVMRRDAQASRRQSAAGLTREGRAARDAWTRTVIRQFPRLLGVLTFVAFAIGAEMAIANLPTLSDRAVTQAARAQLHLIAISMSLAAAAFYLYALARRKLAQNAFFRVTDAALGRAFAWLFRVLRIAPRRDDPDAELHATGRLLLLAYAVGVIILLVSDPFSLAHLFPLAFAIPLILGGWVPIMSGLSSLGRRMRFPIITALLAASVVGVYVFGDNHKVRIHPQVNPPPPQRLDITAAVDLWMHANDCESAPQTCPRPIIVAAAGGASRAGFFTASVLGHFLDAARHLNGFSVLRADGTSLVRTPYDDGRMSSSVAAALSGADIANRIFAISGVSGGAYGAAVTAAALGARTGTAHPCKGGPQPHWFGKKITTWQDCLESLTAGDYLTATFFGLTFHDQIQALLDDRAALLEKSWEKRFSDIVVSDIAASDGTPSGRLGRPFLARDRDQHAWVPFLVLNGTSVETGQRIVTTDLLPTYSARRSCPNGALDAACPLFTQTLDFHALLEPGRDVALSTAALNSARFPIISPPGSIVQGKGQIVDRIVDGGYFENYGAESALELAQAMVDVAPQLAPFILVISNDPQSTLIQAQNPRDTVTPDAREHVWLPEVTGPLGAIGTVRSGRGRLAVAEAERWLNARFAVRCPVNLAHIKVWPEAADGTCPVGMPPTKIRDVSMSWWLSKPVQMNLRQQLEHPNGRRSNKDCHNDEAVTAMWQALATPSAACAPQD